MIQISVPDKNDSLSRIVLSQKDYLIRFFYNMTYDYWSFGLSDIEGTPIIGLLKIVPLSPLTHFYRSVKLPDGIFGAITDRDHIGRNDFLNGNAQFLYIPWEEVGELEVGVL